ncbi:hypothetical protein RFI_00887 [Reticulomyxa filosa]|uniref:Tetratricopeptide repeat protein n=1 Tax=Reticulomyxa filosa TaxID=46433 RepID=X6PDP0_RETFI|nr:hypothetical protein RFI_00887 [Reticulomyxa filosa]|eukprot:ETO36174.1 hypothetical protein RFI_00887 [Reticulomyxa filosa]
MQKLIVITDPLSLFPCQLISIEQTPNPDYDLFSGLYNVLGCAYWIMVDKKKGTYYFKKELDIYSKQPEADDIDFQSCLYNLGAMHCVMKQYDKAIYYLEQIEKGREHLEKGLKFF